jgi:hypothetical protein
MSEILLLFYFSKLVSAATAFVHLCAAESAEIQSQKTLLDTGMVLRKSRIWMFMLVGRRFKERREWAGNFFLPQPSGVVQCCVEKVLTVTTGAAEVEKNDVAVKVLQTSCAGSSKE